MTFENIPSSSQSDGRWRITNVPLGEDASSCAVLNGETASPITYGLTPDGWARSITQATVEDKRLTLLQDLTRPGKVTEAIEIKAVVSADPKSADAILKGLSASQAESQFVQRQGVGNEIEHEVDQVADIITGVVGVRRPDAPVENGVDTVSYTLFITKPTRSEVALVA